MPNQPLRLIGTSEVAERLECDTSTVHRLVNAGRLRFAVKAPGLRGAYMFDPAEVESYLSNREPAEAAS